MSDEVGNIFWLAEYLHLAGKADAIVDRGGLVEEIELDLADALDFIEHVILDAPLFDDLGILEDGFDDSLILCESLLGEGDVDVQVGEGSVELVVMRGREL